MAEESILSKIIDGVAAVAPTVANMVIPGSGPVLHDLMRSVTGDPPGTPIEQVAAKIDADPALLLKLKQVAAQKEIRLAEIAHDDLESVNETMRAESKSEHWPQYSWRPWNGFWYPVAVIAIYFGLPCLGKPIPDVPIYIWLGWGAILGVTTWHRGKAQRAAAGDTGMVAGLVKAIKGDANNAAS